MLKSYLYGMGIIALHVIHTLVVYRVRCRRFLPVACGAMFRLNRKARDLGDCPERRSIYDLKNRFVRLLYEAGFCVDVTKHHQDYVCWRCEGSGDEPYGWYHEDDEDPEPCRKCRGTGLYRRNVLYCFTFDVMGTQWVWHQPENLVTWDVDLTDDQPNRYTNGGDQAYEDDYTVERARLDAVAVWAALRFCKAGVGFDDWRKVKFPVEMFPGRAVRRHGVRFLARRAVTKARVRLGLEEEIPF